MLNLEMLPLIEQIFVLIDDFFIYVYMYVTVCT